MNPLRPTFTAHEIKRVDGIYRRPKLRGQTNQLIRNVRKMVQTIAATAAARRAE